ncbi:hypothetical protein [Rhodoferax bucti]|uniref:hypothetical protein n=1 Tax=Rhodoferax bucti TaxID=2576305 RepID=UPI001476E89E|nr:hypothetical protein [Rhodoferax bucti]
MAATLQQSGSDGVKFFATFVILLAWMKIAAAGPSPYAMALLLALFWRYQGFFLYFHVNQD